jgi:hypothetical protein
MIEVRFEKSRTEEEVEPCSNFKYIVYMVMGYPYYVLQSMISYGSDSEKSWEIYKCSD